MSLRTFHIVFVTISTLLFVFLAVWSFLLAGDRGAVVTVMKVIGIAGAVVMPVYGVCFYRKVRKIAL